MATLTLDVRPEPGPGQACWTGTWAVDGTPVGDRIPPDAAADAALADAGHRFLDRFERRDVRPVAAPDDLRAHGRLLHDRWFGPAWAAVAPLLATGPHELLVRSPDPRVLNWPWELVELFPPLPLGCDAGWSLRRTPLDALSADAPLAPGPLRLLFLAAAPTDQAQLDYEREEDAMLRATARIPEEAAVVFAETGGIDELADLVAEHRPHVVHLSGHGVVAGGTGTFAFEDERGHTDGREADEIVAKVFRGSGVRCVFLNGCQTSQAATAGLAQALVKAGVPLVVGWSASVADDRATEFAEVFYARLVRGEPVPAAAAHAREAVRGKGRVRVGQHEFQDATFALPQVYCSAKGSGVFDRAAPPVPPKVPQVRPTLLEDGIKGLREGFVGRRRDIQKLVPALRSGETTFAVLTGIGGAGKSTLATKAANELKRAGFRVYGVRVPGGGTATASCKATIPKILDAFERAFVQFGRHDLHRQIVNPTTALRVRLQLAVDGLRELRAVFVLDNFEECLHIQTRKVADPVLADLYQFASTHLIAGSRFVITSRYLPASTPDRAEQGTVSHLALRDFEEYEFLKLLRRDLRVDARMRAGSLSEGAVRMLYASVGGNPGFSTQMRAVLRTISSDDLAEMLAEGPTATMPGERQRYYESLFLPKLYNALPGPAREVLRHCSVSHIPLPADALATTLGWDSVTASSAVDAAVAYGLLQMFEEDDEPSLYDPPALVRSWMSGIALRKGERLSTIHSSIAEVLKSYVLDGRIRSLRAMPDAVLFACLQHARLGKEASIARWCATGLARLLVRFGDARRAVELLESVPMSDDVPFLVSYASAVENVGDWRKARQLLKRAQRLEKSQSPGRLQADNDAATLDLRSGKTTAARATLGSVVESSLNSGNRQAECAAIHNLAAVDIAEGKYADARVRLQKAIEMHQEAESSDLTASIHNLAIVDLRERRYVEAESGFRESLRLARETANRYIEAASLHNIGSLHLERKEYADALGNLAGALLIRQRIGYWEGEAATLHQLAVLAEEMKIRSGAELFAAMSYLILMQIGHSNADSASQNLATLLRRRHGNKVGSSDVDKILQEAAAAYMKDKGNSLVESLFKQRKLNLRR